MLNGRVYVYVCVCLSLNGLLLYSSYRKGVGKKKANVLEAKETETKTTAGRKEQCKQQQQQKKKAYELLPLSDKKEIKDN